MSLLNFHETSLRKFDVSDNAPNVLRKRWYKGKQIGPSSYTAISMRESVG